MLHGYRILIIHTEPLIGEYLADALRAEGAEIVGPARGLKHTFESAEAIDLRVRVLNFIF